MKRIGILTSGGDAPGMNACIRAAVRAATAGDIEILGINRGYSGLIENDIHSLDRRTVANIIHLGGTILGTSRSTEFRTREGRNKAFSVLEEHGIEGLIIIGGEGSFLGGSLLQDESGVKIIGIPGTIDNDVYGTDLTIGFDTAVNCALEAIDRIRDTALSHQRLFFVEVMGRHTGFIALESGIGGGAEELIIPEESMNAEELSSRLQRSFSLGKKSAIVAVAEAGRPGNSVDLAKEVEQRTGFETKVCILGHLQRGGSPTARDRILASKLGVAAVNALMQGKSGLMAGEIKQKIAFTPIQESWERQKSLDSELRDLMGVLCD
ncbi:MAG: 6-phosphofructokinase [Desulfohalobiaceae bacterium]|nr:6-phosphofructokinase [Desulfohalobiaceae bacterium]